ncbi:MAG: hypothetical protein WCX61_04880 [Candidatus Peribacteraceae bacterium]|jgi:phenylacetate-CoA ligase
MASKGSAYSSPDLLASQWWSIDELEAFQNRRLLKIIKYAYANIPGYKKKFDQAGVKPRDIRTKEDLWKVPITTRQELQENKDFINEKAIADTLYTGGSTGTSLQYYDSQESMRVRRQAHLRGWSWNGYTPGKRLAVISSAQGVVKKKNVLNLMGDLCTESLQRNVESLLQFRPQHLRGYVGSLYLLAKYCLENSIQCHRIESVNPISENLYDFQRKTMEKAFQCEVFEEYCCNDGGACAWECEAHQGLHYCMERAIIEDVDGEMIVTDLWNTALPFIRYQNGDAVRFLTERCLCGRALPLIAVRGRANDFIITKTGVISPSFLLHHGIGLVGVDKNKNDFKDGIRAVQYVQKPGYVLEVNVVKNSWCSSDEIERFKKGLAQIATGMEIRINFVQDIPATKAGKRSFIVNEDSVLLNNICYRDTKFERLNKSFCNTI